MPFEKFELRTPSPQTAVDIFAGRWASDLSSVCSVTGTGVVDLFVGDPRPKMAANALGVAGRLDGMSILELGPLEAGHSFQMEHLGAKSILGVEANSEAYLKCLIVKELLGLKKTRFVLGDVIQYLSATPDVFDMIFCSGIIYHMKNPINLIKLISETTNKCFVWTHYYNEESGDKEGTRTRRQVVEHGFEATYYELAYETSQEGNFWGGNDNTRAWMTRDELIAGFAHFGLSNIQILNDTLVHPHGAEITFVASR